MKLKVGERLLILNLLPTQGDMVTLRVVKDAVEALSLKTDEMKSVDLKTIESPDGKNQLKWDTSKDEGVDIELSKAAIGIAREKLKEMNDQKKLQFQHMDLYERIVERTDQADKPKKTKK